MTLLSRRGFLLATGALVAGSVRAARAQQQPLAGQGVTGALRDPAAAGPSQEPATPRDNESFVQGVEHRIKCTCGCNLDVYTCRTTDFTCATSPRMHREVLALQDSGNTADQIVAAFVAKYGEQVLMAPKPEGFNLAGYLVPGVALLTGGAILALILRRRMRAMPRPAPAAVPQLQATREELARLDRELADLERE